MANWEKLIEEHYSKKNKIDENTIFELIEQALLAEGYQDSEVIKNHPSMRLSTKGTKKAGGEPYDEDPPKARSKSAPAGFGVLQEEEGLPKTKKDIVDVLVNAFKKDYSDATPKLNSKKALLGIDNLGGRFDRADFAKKAKEYLMQTYDLDDSDVALVADDEKVIRKLNVKGNKIGLYQGKGGSGSEATKFEANLLHALLGGTHDDEKFKEFGDGINQDKRWQDSATAIVKALKTKGAGAPGYATGLPEIKPAETSKSSGGTITTSLTTTYTKWGATSKEAKADLQINGIGCSVKKLEESQFMATQGPECAAVFDVVMRKSPELIGELEKDVDVFLTQLKRIMGTTKNIDKQMDGASAAIDAYVDADDPASGLDDTFQGVGDSKGMSQPVRAKVARDMEANWDKLSSATKNKIAGADSQKKPTESQLKTIAQKQLTQLLYIDCGGDMDETEKKIFDAAVKNAGVGSGESVSKPFVSIANSLSGVLNSNAFRIGVMKEGITGDGKFENEEAKAKAVLKWSVGKPESSYYVDLMKDGAYNEKVFTSLASGMKLGIRDRGSNRGLSMRGDAIASQACKDASEPTETNELKEPGTSDLLPLIALERLDLSVVSDWSFSEEEQTQIQEDAAAIYESAIGDEILTEQLMEGWFTDLLDNGVDVVSKGIGWVKGKFEKVMKVISQSIAKLANWFKSVLAKSFSTFMKAFGFEPEKSSIVIPIP